MRLGVNIDHVATLRNARRVCEPSVLEAAFVAASAGAEQVTIHLREDRRHMLDSDIIALTRHCPLPLNVECALNDGVLSLLKEVRPRRVTFVPEKRQEVTTEGGLDAVALESKLRCEVENFHALGVKVSLFIDALDSQIYAAQKVGADAVELHTGAYANLFLSLNSPLNRGDFALKDLAQKSVVELESALEDSLKLLKDAAKLAQTLGLEVYAGHGLNYQNVGEIAEISHISELNIGHSIVARAVFVGLKNAILEMKGLLLGAGA